MFWYASLGFSLWEAVRAFHRYHLYCNLWHGNTRIIGLSTITSVLFAAVELCKRSLRATPTQTKPMLGTRLCPLPSATIGQIERQKEARLGRRRPTEGVNGKQRLFFFGNSIQHISNHLLLIVFRVILTMQMIYTVGNKSSFTFYWLSTPLTVHFLFLPIVSTALSSRDPFPKSALMLSVLAPDPAAKPGSFL